MISGKGRRGSRGCGVGSFRRALRAEALRRDELPRTAAPALAAAGPRRHARAECADRRAKGHSHRAGTPRIFQVGPSSVKGTPRSFLTASQKGSSGPTLERRSLCRPSGPDGEGQAKGQARRARGEILQATLTNQEDKGRVTVESSSLSDSTTGTSSCDIERLSRSSSATGPSSDLRPDINSRRTRSCSAICRSSILNTRLCVIITDGCQMVRLRSSSAASR